MSYICRSIIKWPPLLSFWFFWRIFSPFLYHIKSTLYVTQCKMDILKHYGYVVSFDGPIGECDTFYWQRDTILFQQFTGSQESVVNMDLDAPIISGLRPGHRRGAPSPSVVVAGHHSSPQRSPSADIQLGASSSDQSGRTGTVIKLDVYRFHP